MGASFKELVTGFSTGLAATMVLVFVIKITYDEADRRQRAPATLAALHHCTLIFDDFRYIWLNMADALSLEHGGKWYEREFFDQIKQRLDLQAQRQTRI
jgi:hypothetical protein